jgi:hypothetical protein
MQAGPAGAGCVKSGALVRSAYATRHQIASNAPAAAGRAGAHVPPVLTAAEAATASQRSTAAAMCCCNLSSSSQTAAASKNLIHAHYS